MRLEAIAPRFLPAQPARWRPALARLAAAWAVLLTLTFPEWREMAHQWWDIDTYNHVLLVPPIVAWLVWLRREELARLEPLGSTFGLAWVAVGLAVRMAGSETGINLVAQAGTVTAFQGAVLALLGVRAALVLAFPLLYTGFLVPFGDELIPQFQRVTADLAVWLSHLSGVPATLEGYRIATPAGLFVVAEECSGVKFLIAMVALATLVAWTGLRSWGRRIALVLGAAAVSVLANGVRAWGTIWMAQRIGIERAGGFDHIVYGWIFFAVVIAVVLGVAWRFLERTPAEAGLTADQATAHPLARLERFACLPDRALLAIGGIAIGFAALAALV
jgi:exosortase A